MDRSSRPKALAVYRLEVLDGEHLLYNPEQTRIVSLNETASLIWRLCNGERTVAEITSLLADAFPEAADAIADDVTVALEELLQHGAIELV